MNFQLVATPSLEKSAPTTDKPSPFGEATIIPLVKPSMTISKSEPADNWPRLWLKGIPCSPPCWEGITPGETTKLQAEEVLIQSSIIATTKTYTLVDSNAISWNWAKGGSGGYLRYSNQPALQTVYGIWPTYPTRFSFRDVSESYGEPSHIMARGFRSPYENKTYSQLWIIYLTKGFALSTGQKTLTENTIFRDLVYFAPTLEGFIKVEPLPKLHPDWLIPWQGFRGFDFYCRDESNGEDCRKAESR